MKNVIILANLGNRNVAVKGDDRELKDIAKAAGISFSAYTQELVETQAPEQWAESLELRILPPLLDKYQAEAKVVYLFYTKQDDLPDGKPDSDTEFSAQLAAELIARNWGMDVRLIRVDCVPVDTEALMRFYRRQLLELEETYPDAKWVVADAGGTTQQKSALKLVGEFLVHGPEKVVQSKIAFYNILEERDGGSRLDPLPHNQFRKSLDILQATALIEVGLYKLADKILGNEYLSPILKYLDRRLAGFKNDTERRTYEYLLQDGRYKKWKSEEFNLLEPIQADEKLAQAVAMRDLQPALERLQAAQFFMKESMPGEFLMALMPFAEKFAFGAFKQMAGILGADQKKQYKGLMDSPRFAEWKAAALAKSSFAREVEQKQISAKKEFHFGSAFDLAVARESTHPAVSHICKKLCDWSYDDMFRPGDVPKLKNGPKRNDIRALRNSLAHDGIRVDFDELETHIPGLRAEVGTWPRLLGLPDENYYLRANRRLKQHLRQLRN